MHQAALLGQALRDSRNYGWNVEETVKHDWERMTEAVQNHIGSLNWGYRVALREKKVTYENAYGEFVGPHRIKATNNKGKEKIYSAERFLIATGERPRYLGIPGDKEYCISSDDLFSLPYCPGKTLVVGASYVALECAGFLAGIGLDVTVMVRSILLRGFDQDMANKIGEHMQEHGIKFIRQFVPIKVEQIEAGTPGRLRVIAKSTDSDQTIEGEYNTVLLAIGRDACTRKIGLENVGVKINEKTGKIPVTEEEQTNVPYIYAIGDILEGKLELTPWPSRQEGCWLRGCMVAPLLSVTMKTFQRLFSLLWNMGLVVFLRRKLWRNLGKKMLRFTIVTFGHWNGRFHQGITTNVTQK